MLALFKDRYYRVIFIFMSFFYCEYIFYFGRDNNVEELPLIYKKSGFAEFANDAFVQEATNGLNYLFAYLSIFSTAAVTFGINSLPYIFFVCHFFTFLALLIAIKNIILLIRPETSPRGVLFVFIALLFSFSVIQLVPNHRALFWSYLDPEFVCFPFLFWSIFFFLNNKFGKAVILLFIGNLFHPLFSIPVCGAYTLLLFCQYIVRRQYQYLIKICLILLAILPYSLLLFIFNDRTYSSIYEASLIHEIVTHPHHLVIPSLRSHDRMSYMRFMEVISLLISFTILLTIILSQKNDIPYSIKNIIRNLKVQLYKDEWTGKFKLLIITLSLIAYLLTSSFISSFIRIPTLIQLTPYRMVVFVYTFTLILFFTTFYNLWKVPTFKLIKNGQNIFLFTLVIFTIYRHSTAPPLYDEHASDMIEYINKSVDTDDIFLNYSDIDLRTQCFKSEYFRIKTIPLSDKEQVNWYERLIIYFDLPERINPTDYHAVGKYIRRYEGVNIEIDNVFENINSVKPKYLLIGNEDQFKIKITKSWYLLFSSNNYSLYKHTN